VDLAELETPALAVDLDVVERNVREMAEHARRHGVALRPHAKTHKSPEIAALQLEAGAVGLTLAKLGELEALLDTSVAEQLHDVLLAFPIVGAQKIARLLALAVRTRMTVSLDSPEAAAEIGAAASDAGRTVGILVEVDTGGRRCGVLPGEPAVDLARRVAATPGLELRGIMTHEGQAYGAADPDDLRAVSLAAGRTMVETAGAIRAAGLEAPVVSVGSTPSARHIAAVPGVTEIRPGTYVFYDYNQVRLGVARPEDCAARVLATVIARPAPDRAVIDAGTKAVAADRHMIKVEQEGFGLVVDQPGWFFARASEEHGVLLRQDDAPADDLRVGQRVAVIPNHICPAVNLYDAFAAHRGGTIAAILPIAARGRSQ
jgi:D-serine deaminase-like pyridoxal phosphate-dependent protein